MESLLGFQRQIPFIDDSLIPIDKIGVSQFGEEISIQGKGFGTDGHRGDLILKILFSLPQTLTEEQRAAVETTL